MTGIAASLTRQPEDNLLAKLRAVPKPKLQPVGYKLPGLLALATSAGELLSATVASTVIQSLRDDPELASWVQTGLSLYHERGQAECLFCGRQVPPDRLASLESHFSTAYRDFMRTLEEHIATVQGEMSALRRTCLCQALRSFTPTFLRITRKQPRRCAMHATRPFVRTPRFADGIGGQEDATF